MASKYFPAWCVGNLKKRVILTSYEASFAASWGRKARDVLEEWGQVLYGVTVSNASSAADWWELTGGQGAMMTAGAGGPITGKGADILIIDDPIKNAEEASSATRRAHLWEWYTSTAYTRLEPHAGVLLIQTRWHEDDLAGRLLAAQAQGADSWEHFNFPALAEHAESYALAGHTWYTRQIGEALWPERYPIDKLAAIQSAVGVRVWSALYQQHPAPDDGIVWRREYFTHRYQEMPTCQKIIQVVDTAFKTGTGSDYSVIATWGATETGYALLDIWRDRVEFPELVQAIRDQAAKWHPSAILVEDAAAGQSAIQALRRSTRLSVIAVPAAGSKVSRADAVSPLGAAGKIMLPEHAPWLAEWIEEHVAFPTGTHDDQPDTTSYALRYLSQAARGLDALRARDARRQQRVTAALPPEIRLMETS